MQPPQIELGWQRLSDEEREREYSPSSCVGGNIEPFLVEYAESSEAARRWCESAGHPVETVAYGPAATQSIDIATPGIPNAPLVFFIHGGYWQQLSKRESFGAANGFVANDIAYAAVDYTLAPEATVAEIVTECRTAMQAVRDNSTELGIDADRIIIAGSSAGAHLAAMVALDPTSPRLAGMVLLSGVYELEPLIGTSINEALGLDHATARSLSPLLLPMTDQPPAVIAYGDNETQQFKKQSHAFGQRLVANGSPVTELEVAGRNHFDILTDFGDLDSELGQAIRRLIDATPKQH